MANTRMKVIVGLSGGVDSAVAALRLLEAGHQVEGLFMKNWAEDDEIGYCAAAEDLKEAMGVAETLEIPLHKVNFARQYWDRVFRHFLYEYQAGRTPNPDILCNREIKFRVFLDYAIKLGADAIATGHYARIGTGYILLRGIDRGKDQSYFLYALNRDQLRFSLFPLGNLHKSEVRAIAYTAGLPNYQRKDSTGICFIGERRFREFLGRYLPAQPGDIITPDGTIIGRHQGLMFYTLGQRQGLGIGGLANQLGAPWYVAEKSLGTNRLIVVQGHDHPLLFNNGLQADEVSWIASPPLKSEFRATAQIRYRQKPQDCLVRVQGKDIDVRFSSPQRAVTPGQSIVLYQGEICLGGGVISRGYNLPNSELPRSPSAESAAFSP